MLPYVRKWFTDRFALQQIHDNVLDRRVARGPWYYGDGATLMLLFGVLVVTGALMTLTYSPSIDAAYDSVIFITMHQWMGWFIRGLHYWSAGLMVVMVFVHVMRQLLVGGYKFPREGTWLVGVMLFFCILVMSYTGYLLRWDERAIYALRVALTMFYRVPLVGEWLVVLVQGGREIGAATLTRLYSVHVLFVPLLMFGLIGYHLYLVIVHSVTSPSEQEQPVYSSDHQRRIYAGDAYSATRGEVFFPETALKSGLMSVAVFAVAVALTCFFGAGRLYPAANLVDPSMPAEEWWWGWFSGLVALLPPSISYWFMVVFPIALFVAMIALPLVDRGPYRGMRKRPGFVGFVVVTVIAVLYLSDLRRRSPFTGWPDDEPPGVPAGITLTAEAEEGRQLYSRYGCNSCHAIAGHGPHVGPDLARLDERWSLDEIRQFTLRPPKGVAMPAYEGRLSDEQLNAIVEFVHVAQTFPRKQ